MYIMTKHGITEAMLRGKEHPDEKPTFKVFKKFRPYANIKSMLLGVVAYMVDGRVVEQGEDLYVFAYETDLEKVQFLYFSLLAQMHIEASCVDIPLGTSKRAFMDSWLKGYVYGVGSKLDRVMRKAKTETPGSALVLANRAEKVNASVERQFVNIRTRNLGSVSTRRAFSDGATKGKQADVGQDRLGRTAGQKALDSAVKSM